MEMAATENVHLASRLLEVEEHILAEVNSLEAKVHTLSESLDIAKTERDELADRLTELESQKVVTKQHSQLYLEGVRQCCIELLSLNVSMKNIEPVIRSVLRHMVNMEVDTLPKPTTMGDMMAEMKGLACQQLAE